MKFSNLLKSIIIEASRFEVLMDKFVKSDKVGKDRVAQSNKIPKEVFFELIQTDPTSRLNNVDLQSASKDELQKVKVGAYVPWLIKQFLTIQTERQLGEPGYEQELTALKNRFREDLYKVTDDLKKFDRFKNKLPQELRDINKLSIETLYDAVKDFDLTMATTSKSERKSLPVHPGAEMGYEGDIWKVIKIEDKGEKGKEAACFYGGNQQETRWCTSGPGLTYFNNYIKDGPLYVLYKKNDTDVSPTTGLPKERYQFHFPSNQFMDRDDRNIDLVGYLNGPMEELKQYFKPEFAKGLTAGNGESLSIEGFDRGVVGKFVGLYGLEELFDSLPNTLTDISISNTSKGGPIITIPKSISKFKNLQNLSLSNCIREIPSEVCELNQLEFVGFMNNPELRTIPECLANMPNIYFMNIDGSPNVQLPEVFRQKWNMIDEGLWENEQ